MVAFSRFSRSKRQETSSSNSSSSSSFCCSKSDAGSDCSSLRQECLDCQQQPLPLPSAILDNWSFPSSRSGLRSSNSSCSSSSSSSSNGRLFLRQPRHAAAFPAKENRPLSRFSSGGSTGSRPDPSSPHHLQQQLQQQPQQQQQRSPATARSPAGCCCCSDSSTHSGGSNELCLARRRSGTCSLQMLQQQLQQQQVLLPEDDHHRQHHHHHVLQEQQHHHQHHHPQQQQQQQQQLKPALCMVLNLPTLIEARGVRCLILDAPTNENLPAYLNELKKAGAKDLVRTCPLTYNEEVVAAAGIRVHELTFPDGEAPTAEVISKWREIMAKAQKEGGVVAVHCVAGLGRGPVLVALSLIDNGFDAEGAVNFIRARRKGAINRRQLAFLHTYRRHAVASRRCMRGCTIMRRFMHFFAPRRAGS